MSDIVRNVDGDIHRESPLYILPPESVSPNDGQHHHRYRVVRCGLSSACESRHHRPPTEPLLSRSLLVLWWLSQMTRSPPALRLHQPTGTSELLPRLLRRKRPTVSCDDRQSIQTESLRRYAS